MDIFEAINTRRSIRDYTDEAIAADDIKTILRSAMLAPSARNERPWQFIVIQDPEQREKISHVSQYTGMAKRAPLVIMVCGDLSLEKAPGMWVQDCSACIENLMLAARGLNIGSVWCGVHPVQERETNARRILGLPENIIPLGIVCLGHPAKEFHEEDRFLEDRIHHEKW